MMRSTFVDVLDQQCSCAAKNPKTAGVDKVMQSLVAVVTQRDSVMSDACILLVRESRVKRRDGVNATHGLCAVEDACMHFR